MTIRETIRQAQGTMATMGRRYTRTYHLGGVRWGGKYIIWEQPPIQYPQSLGELCLELLADRVSGVGPHGYLHEWTPRDIEGGMALRRALYHRRTA
jgi:hypothetical protein